MSLMEILCFSYASQASSSVNHLLCFLRSYLVAPQFLFFTRVSRISSVSKYLLWLRKKTKKRREKEGILPEKKKEKKIDRTDNWDPGSRLLPVFLTRYSASQKGDGEGRKERKGKEKGNDQEKYEVNLKRGSGGWAFSSRGLRVFVVDDRRSKKTREGGMVATRVGGGGRKSRTN